MGDGEVGGGDVGDAGAAALMWGRQKRAAGKQYRPSPGHFRRKGTNSQRLRQEQGALQGKPPRSGQPAQRRTGSDPPKRFPETRKHRAGPAADSFAA